KYFVVIGHESDAPRVKVGLPHRRPRRIRSDVTAQAVLVTPHRRLDRFEAFERRGVLNQMLAPRFGLAPAIGAADDHIVARQQQRRGEIPIHTLRARSFFPRLDDAQAILVESVKYIVVFAGALRQFEGRAGVGELRAIKPSLALGRARLAVGQAVGPIVGPTVALMVREVFGDFYGLRRFAPDLLAVDHAVQQFDFVVDGLFGGGGEDLVSLFDDADAFGQVAGDGCRRAGRFSDLKTQLQAVAERARGRGDALHTVEGPVR